MKRIAILTAGGDTPALNATIHGAVVRANQLRIEVFGLIKGFNSLFFMGNPSMNSGLTPRFAGCTELCRISKERITDPSRHWPTSRPPTSAPIASYRLARLILFP